MIARWLTKKLEYQLDRSPAVALLGARQVGKTTLARHLAHYRPSLYLDLEAPEDLVKLTDPSRFLSIHRDKLVIIDEVQRAPELFQVLRGLIDDNRQKGRRSGQYLVLGSASMQLLRQSSESLAGRISYLEMNGLNILEIDSADELNALWLRGGFPDSYLAGSDDDSMVWIEDLIRTYLERDIPQLGFRIPSARLRRLWTMLAHLQGETINRSKLGSNLDVDAKTIAHYLDVLTDLLLIRRLNPWHSNVKKRLVKSPRFYIRDSGIMHRLLEIHSSDHLLSHPVFGKSWEGFVIENIHSVLPKLAQCYYYRTSDGSEIDLVIQYGSEHRWAIEIKSGIAPRIGRRFVQSCEDINASKRYVVYGGNETIPLDELTEMISLRTIMQKLTRISSAETR